MKLLGKPVMTNIMSQSYCYVHIIIHNDVARSIYYVQVTTLDYCCSLNKHIKASNK